MQSGPDDTDFQKKSKLLSSKESCLFVNFLYCILFKDVFFFTFKHTVHKFNIRILLILGGNLHILAVLITTQHFGHFCLRHTPRYSIRSSPIRPNFQMTNFKAKHVFLVFGMGHTMNKLTYECKKMQKLKALVILQCKWERLDTPKIGLIRFFLAVK